MHHHTLSQVLQNLTGSDSVGFSVVDLLNPDPDPAFQVNPDHRIQGFDDQETKKNTAENLLMSFLNQKLQFIYP
jgi:hypothetical protein